MVKEHLNVAIEYQPMDGSISIFNNHLFEIYDLFDKSSKEAPVVKLYRTKLLVEYLNNTFEIDTAKDRYGTQNAKNVEGYRKIIIGCTLFLRSDNNKCNKLGPDFFNFSAFGDDLSIRDIHDLGDTFYEFGEHPFVPSNYASFYCDEFTTTSLGIDYNHKQYVSRFDENGDMYYLIDFNDLSNMTVTDNSAVKIQGVEKLLNFRDICESYKEHCKRVYNLGCYL